MLSSSSVAEHKTDDKAADEGRLAYVMTIAAVAVQYTEPDVTMVMKDGNTIQLKRRVQRPCMEIASSPTDLKQFRKVAGYFSLAYERLEDLMASQRELYGTIPIPALFFRIRMLDALAVPEEQKADKVRKACKACKAYVFGDFVLEEKLNDHHHPEDGSRSFKFSRGYYIELGRRHPRWEAHPLYEEALLEIQISIAFMAMSWDGPPPYHPKYVEEQPQTECCMPLPKKYPQPPVQCEKLEKSCRDGKNSEHHSSLTGVLATLVNQLGLKKVAKNPENK